MSNILASNSQQLAGMINKLSSSFPDNSRQVGYETVNYNSEPTEFESGLYLSLFQAKDRDEEKIILDQLSKGMGLKLTLGMWNSLVRESRATKEQKIVQVANYTSLIALRDFHNIPIAFMAYYENMNIVLGAYVLYQALISSLGSIDITAEHRQHCLKITSMLQQDHVAGVAQYGLDVLFDGSTISPES